MCRRKGGHTCGHMESGASVRIAIEWDGSSWKRSDQRKDMI